MAGGPQRVTGRNWTYVAVPWGILAILLCVLAWELARQNMQAKAWPWSLALLGVTPAASLSGVFAGLILARGQFARSVRPGLGWIADEGPSSGLGASAAWTAHLYNAGPGHAVVTSVLYRVDTWEAAGGEAWFLRDAAVARLEAFGLLEGRDYKLRLLTAGAPLPAVKKVDEGIEMCSLSRQSMGRLRRLDVRVEVQDSVGDRHAKSVALIEVAPAALRLPRPAPE